MKKKNKFKVNVESGEDVNLQITSMADIFMIILVFLLKSYSTGLSTVSPSQGDLLPEARAPALLKDALKIEILKDAVLVDQKSAASLKNFNFSADPNSREGEAGNDAIYKALLNQRKRMTGDATDSHLLVLADQRTPYATLKRVMNSAASAGFVDLQLAVVQAE